MKVLFFSNYSSYRIGLIASTVRKGDSIEFVVLIDVKCSLTGSRIIPAVLLDLHSASSSLQDTLLKTLPTKTSKALLAVSQLSAKQNFRRSVLTFGYMLLRSEASILAAYVQQR
ncbi:MAG: hypothetical protein ACTS73_01800 [Arsenophonus sp. NEOnobi-MAG3]